MLAGTTEMIQIAAFNMKDKVKINGAIWSFIACEEWRGIEKWTMLKYMGKMGVFDCSQEEMIKKITKILKEKNIESKIGMYLLDG